MEEKKELEQEEITEEKVNAEANAEEPEEAVPEEPERASSEEPEDGGEEAEQASGPGGKKGFFRKKEKKDKRARGI